MMPSGVVISVLHSASWFSSSPNRLMVTLNAGLVTLSSLRFREIGMLFVRDEIVYALILNMKNSVSEKKIRVALLQISRFVKMVGQCVLLCNLLCRKH